MNQRNWKRAVKHRLAMLFSTKFAFSFYWKNFISIFLVHFIHEIKAINSALDLGEGEIVYAYFYKRKVFKC